ncbi:MAG: hypothetical protein WGN25_19385 [Candidatus Electrothrix sp. GW3-4]|uniref:TolB family protein n=1 Tax=Candidatus Electrothrix sp. GW3-4 TaxID=3126740 RepID=UPI0030CDB936
MRKKSNRHTVQLFIFFLSFLIVSCLGKEGKAASVQQDLVWSQSDGLRHEIFSSMKKDGEWTIPVKITDNNADNLHPVLDRGDDGTKWLFWSAVRPDGISVEYAVFQDNEWSEPQKLPMEQHSSIAPSVLADKKEGLLLVWAGNDGGNDDIYYSRYQGKRWSDPQVIHAPNEVPDIKPEIAYNEEGKIEVSWIGFRGNTYIKLASVYTDKTGWSAEQEKLEREEEKVEDDKEQDVKLPSFLPSNSQFFLKIY